MPGKRSLDATVERRIGEVFKLLLRGASRDDILKHLGDSGVDAESTVNWYVSKANARFKELSKANSERELGRQLARLEDLYSRVFRIQDYRTALAVAKERNELLGLYPAKTEKHEHSGPGGGPIQIERVLSDDELALRLRLELDGRAEGPALRAPHPEPAGAD